MAFPVEKKRLKEALFATLEMPFFCEDLKRKAGLAPKSNIKH